MLVRIYFFVVPGDVAVRINNKCLPLRHCHAKHARFYAVNRRRLTVGVGKQREGQAIFFSERLVRFSIVQTDTQDLCVNIAEGENIVAEITGLGRADRSPVRGVKVQHHPLVTIIFKGVQLAVLIGELKLGGRIPNGNLFVGDTN